MNTKNLTLKPKLLFIAWILAGILTVAFVASAANYVIKQTKAGNINWNQ